MSSFKARNILTILLGVTIIVGALLGTGQNITWAAPGQNPAAQTVPSGRPSPTPVPPAPPASPPQPAPGGGSSSQSPKNEDDGNEVVPQLPQPSTSTENEELLPTQLPEPDNNTGEEVPLPVDSSEQENIEVSPETETEPLQSTENEGDQKIFLEEADLSLGQIVDNATPNTGELIIFTIVISNSGPDNATNVVVRTPLPNDLLSVDSTAPSQGSFDSNIGIWTVGTISAGNQATLKVVAKVIDVGSVTNLAEIITALPFDPDSTPGNGLKGEDDQASVSIRAVSKAAIASSEDSSTTQQGSLVSAPALEIQPEGAQVNLLIYWLLALTLGILLVVIGLFLVYRA